MGQLRIKGSICHVEGYHKYGTLWVNYVLRVQSKRGRVGIVTTPSYTAYPSTQKRPTRATPVLGDVLDLIGKLSKLCFCVLFHSHSSPYIYARK